ncbi:MAG: hypothetical protein BRC25_02080 [Parcubacteria group bacterium SW_6_46_9]|nr:MAG: hypothetical protein BRC25_02080 [Parcubacteria group bacterium SW_6_46_9]
MIVSVVLAVATASILLITNRDNTTSEQNPAQPTTTAPDTAAGSKTNTPDITPPSDKEALKRAFGDGKWVEDIQKYLVWTPTDPDAKEVWGNWHKGKYPLNSRVLASTTVRTESANDKHIILTRTGWSDPPLSATQPFGRRKIGTFTFQYDDTGWGPTYSEPVVESTYDGIYGSSVTSIGSKDNQFAFVIKIGTSPNATNSGGYLFLAYVDGEVKSILNTRDGNPEWSNGVIANDGKIYEFDYDTNFEFAESDTSQFYDMIATKEGIKVDRQTYDTTTTADDTISTTTVFERTRYQFDNSRYQTGSSSTDPAKTDWTNLSLKPLENGSFSNEHGLFATTENGEVMIKGGFDYRSTVEDYGQGLKAVITSCGNPCSLTTFIDLKSDRISKTDYQSVIAVDAQNKRVATVKKNGVAIYDIFTDDRIVFDQNRDFAPTAAPVSAIDEARFTDEGNLFIRYQLGEDFETKSDTIEVGGDDVTDTDFDAKMTFSCESGGTTAELNRTVKSPQTWLGTWKYFEGHEMENGIPGGSWIYELEVHSKDNRLVGDLDVSGKQTQARMRVQITPIVKRGSVGVVFREFKDGKRLGVSDFQRNDLLFTLSRKDQKHAAINWCGLDSHELDYESGGTSRTEYNQQPAFKLQTGKDSKKAGVGTKEIRGASCQSNITNTQSNKSIENPQFWQGEWFYSQDWVREKYHGGYWNAKLNVGLENNDLTGDLLVRDDRTDARIKVKLTPIENSDSLGVIFQEFVSEDWYGVDSEQGDLLFTLKKADENSVIVSWCGLEPPRIDLESNDTTRTEYNQQPAFELNE